MRASESGKAPQRRKPGRVPTACAECRRLKLRCNRQVPCEKCESRGCAAICPDGVLTPGRGNRLVLANTEELHDQIDTMSSRIRQLERALRDLQSSVSVEPHPLLQSDLLLPSSSKPTPTPPPPPPPPPQVPVASTSRSDQSLQKQELPPQSKLDTATRPAVNPYPMSVDAVEGVVEACGTLISTSNSGFLYLGSTARPEFLMRIPSQIRPILNFSSTSRLSKRIINTTFFDSELREVDESLGSEIYSFLPSLPNANALCQIYLEHASYLFIGLTVQEIYDILPPVYQAGSFEVLPSADSVSLLFIIFALGTLFGPQPDLICAQEYFFLSRAALSLSPTRRGVSLTYIQAVVHMTQYLELSNPGLSHSCSVWLYAGYAARLGHDVALQLHNARWQMPSETSISRCRMFWKLFMLDTWTSFYYGRPLIMSPPFIDSPFFKDIPTEHATMSFELWNVKFASVVHNVITIAFGPKQVPYASIIELDRRIRDFHVPSVLRFQCEEEAPDTSYELRMRRYFVSARKEIVLLSLHRPYLVQVLSAKPVELERHRYRASIMACYRSAWRLVYCTIYAFRREPLRMSRISLVWSHCLSSIIVFSLIVTHDPKGSVAPAALRELEVAVDLFQTAAPTSRPAANLLETVHKLLQTAKEAAGQLSISRMGEQEVDPYSPRELERLAGKTTYLHDATGRSLHDPPVQRVNSSAFDQWQRIEFEEDPFQLLNDLTVQQHQSQADMRPSQHGIECMHPILEQDLKDLELGRAFTNTKDINDIPCLRPHPPPPPPLTPSTQPTTPGTSTSAQREQVVGSTAEGSVSDASAFNDSAQLSSLIGLGFNMPQYEQQLVGGLFGSNALLALDPSLQTVAEHLGFHGSLFGYNPYFTPLSY
ncbi:hypothetical protein APHAL10511_005085 [Amanita phalloides]|nr:hypothetical protein APHAL10511_005085 [Amanita phalloides]